MISEQRRAYKMGEGESRKNRPLTTPFGASVNSMRWGRSPRLTGERSW